MERLAAAVPGAFLVNNGAERSDVRAAITSALRGVKTVAAAADRGSQPVTERTTTNQTININSSGPWIGNVGGGGDIAESKQAQQVIGDAAIQGLVARFSDQPEVRQIIQAGPPAERHPRLMAFLRSAGGVAEDLTAKVATELIKSQTGG
jgi:hypothetical protein